MLQSAALRSNLVPLNCRGSLVNQTSSFVAPRQHVFQVSQVHAFGHSVKSFGHYSFGSAQKVCIMARAAGSKTVLVPVANGSEEIEAVTIIDTLRRAGAEVTVASIESGLQVEMSRKVRIVADKLIKDLADQQFDLIALPGGMPGAERLRDSAVLKDLLKQQQASDRFVTAICAAPAVVLEAQGFLEGKKATSHPGFTDKLSDKSNAETRVVVDGKVVTSRGPGTSLEFALSLVKQLFGKQKADEVAGPMVISQGLEY